MPPYGHRGSDVDIEDSSDSEGSNDAGSVEEALFVSCVDPLYGEEGEEDKEYVPPRHQRKVSSSSSSEPSSPDPGLSKRACGRGRGGQASKRPRLASVDLEAQQERWRTKEEPDVEPPATVFQPKHPPGPRIDTTAQWSPLSLFRLFFSSSTINTIISNTNTNSACRLAQGAKYTWSQVTHSIFLCQ
ncbi:piggyBac transposable element-derived protein 4-like [Xyrichtys novacula]|uniref:PiggyBac transposable element-derived protein 4-like n=1 Tax=Xyrichtys novacula TaxID=13765 RepID=A0AAV1FJX2_XYRNO|nr:piggyBac transposable element-derived protein 4-like [Xyrichtys novacula]